MHKVYIQMKDNDPLNTKITMSMLAVMVVFKIIVDPGGDKKIVSNLERP